MVNKGDHLAAVPRAAQLAWFRVAATFRVFVSHHAETTRIENRVPSRYHETEDSTGTRCFVNHRADEDFTGVTRDSTGKPLFTESLFINVLTQLSPGLLPAYSNTIFQIILPISFCR